MLAHHCTCTVGEVRLGEVGLASDKGSVLDVTP